MKIERAKAYALALSLCAPAFGALSLASCTTPSVFLEPIERADRLAEAQGWRRADIAVPGFQLAAWELYRGGERLAVYIESDGHNWNTRYHPSPDPTPLYPRVLEMAAQDPTPNRLYLARPCQYLLSQAELARCSPEYWLERRYAPEVIAGLNRAVDEGKRRSGARHVILVGYSGGGSLAVLVAARRTDVLQIVTVAANLDHQKWTNDHSVTPLHGSLNAIDAAAAVAAIPQTHFVGSNDRIVPRAITDTYMRRLGPPASARTIEIAFDHTCCWSRDWGELLRRYRVYDHPG